jgi:formate dehydrogenase major subunit
MNATELRRPADANTACGETDYGTPARSGAAVALVIDGREVVAPAGTSVMRAALEAGIEIPKLCATDTLEAFGSCRLCLVEIDGRKGYPASCTTPVEAGMVVRTTSPMLEKLRRGVVELYLSDHPAGDDVPGSNALRALAQSLAASATRYAGGRTHLADTRDESNPYFAYDPARCIVCYRCVRACEDIQGSHALTVAGRGFASRVVAGQEQPFMASECVSCGACVAACPTGSLLEKSVLARGMPEKATITTCAYCGVGCAFRVETKGEGAALDIVRMVPHKAGRANEGHACVKGRFAWGYATHADRVTKPMIRDRIDQPWREVGWDEAIAHAAGRLRSIQAKHGRDSIGGITSSRCTNEETWLVQKLVRAAFGNNNVDTCARVCHSPTGYGLKQTLGESAGTQEFRSVEKADVIMVIGANPTEGHPVFASRLKRRLRRGARLIVVDPRRIDLVDSAHVKAEFHLQLQPGSNVAVINALAHVVVTEGLLDEAFVAARCEERSFAQWREFITAPENSPEAMQAHTGVPAALVRGAARLYATGVDGRKNAAIYYGLGVTEHSQGSTMVMGIANLAMATGNLGREGVGVNPLRGQNNVQGSCDMGSFPHELPGYRHISDSIVRGQFEAAWGVSLQTEPGLRIPNMFEAALDGSFRGLYCQGEDLVQSDPNTQHVAAALSAMDCVIVQDIFLNETARYAHVFLPGASFLEKDGTFTNAERRISRVRKVIEPLPGYADWEVTQLLANALGYPMKYAHPHEIMEEIAALTPTFAGVTYEKLDALGSIQWPCNEQAPEGTPTMHVGSFVRGKGRFFITRYVASDEKSNRKYPLLLTTGRVLSQYNVGAQTRRTENTRWHDEDRLEIHPSDAETRGIAEGDWVGIESRAGSTVLRATVTDRVAAGVVYTTFHFPESGANVITTDSSDWATNCPEYKVTAVEVMRVTQPSEWQQRYRRFAAEQERLFRSRRRGDAVTAN